MRLRPWMLKLRLNLYGPYLGAGVSVRRISADWLEMDLVMKTLHVRRKHKDR